MTKIARSLTIKRISAQETLDLRHRVMWPDMPKEYVRLAGDDSALHFGGFHEGILIGVGSFFQDGASYRLRKLAVEPDLQGKGVAETLLANAFVELRALGSERVWCDARVSAMAFYTRLGFEAEGPVFQKQGVHYRKAIKALS